MNIAAFAFEARDLNTFPSIVNALRLLVRDGHTVDVFIPSSMSSDISIEGCNIYIVSEFERYAYVSQSAKIVTEMGKIYDYIFAYYIEGLILAEIITRKVAVRTPIIYVSMELIYKNYPYHLLHNILNPFKLPAKTIMALTRSIPDGNFTFRRIRSLLCAHYKEIAYSILVLKSWRYLMASARDRLAFSVVSDCMRAKALKEELPFVDKVLYAPEAGYVGYNEEISVYAANRFGIPQYKKILLYTGGLEEGFDISLLDVANKLSDDYIMFFNVYSRDGYVNKLVSQFSEEIVKGKVFFQTENLNEDDYDQLVRSAHIGVVWYPPPCPRNSNMYYLGFSSGKLNKFLSCGKPVISSGGIYGYREMIEGNKLGRICEFADEIPGALDDVEADYKLMVQHIKAFYLQHVEFEAKFSDIIAELHKLRGTKYPELTVGM